MAKQSWQATESDLAVARCGSMIQAEACGLDVNDPKIKAFMDNQIKVIASCHAESRWLRKIIDEMTFKNEKVE